MVRARLWLTCAAAHDPVAPVLLRPALIGWEAQRRQVDLTIERPLKGSELLQRMKGWVTVDVALVEETVAAHGRLKLLDERVLVVELEDQEDMQALSKALDRQFGDQVWVEPM